MFDREIKYKWYHFPSNKSGIKTRNLSDIPEIWLQGKTIQETFISWNRNPQVWLFVQIGE